jgi:hypothetical protein
VKKILILTVLATLISGCGMKGTVNRWRRLRNENRCVLIARLRYGPKIAHVHFPAECCLTLEEIYESEKET